VSLTKHPRGSTVTDPALVRRAVKAAALGNAMEWFDFGVYSYIAVTLGKVFFPSGTRRRCRVRHRRWRCRPPGAGLPAFAPSSLVVRRPAAVPSPSPLRPGVRLSVETP
jgi:hypothetical protein